MQLIGSLVIFGDRAKTFDSRVEVGAFHLFRHVEPFRAALVGLLERAQFTQNHGFTSRSFQGLQDSLQSLIPGEDLIRQDFRRERRIQKIEAD